MTVFITEETEALSERWCVLPEVTQTVMANLIQKAVVQASTYSKGSSKYKGL